MRVKIGFEYDPITPDGRGSDDIIRALDRKLGGANWSREGNYFVAEVDD